MKLHPSLLLVGVLAAPSSAQHVRPSTLADAALSTVDGAVIAAAGDLSAAAYEEVALGAVFVTTSDGRGLAWSPPVRVDGDATGADKSIAETSLAVQDEVIYFAWGDERSSSGSFGEIFFSRSTDCGATWQPEQILDDSVPSGGGSVRDFAMAVTTDGTDALVYALISVDPSGPGPEEELFLTVSVDGGQTFQPAVPVLGIGTGVVDVDKIALAADGLTVHAAWQDDRSGTADDVFYRRGTVTKAPFAVTWDTDDQQMDDPATPTSDAENGLDVLIGGSTVAVLFQEGPGGDPSQELRINVSTDGGLSFPGDLRVGPSTTPADVDSPCGAVLPDGTILVAWDDNREGGPDKTFVTRSTDGGATFAREIQVSTGGGNDPDLAGGGDVWALVWESVGSGPDDAESAFTIDGGATWNTLSLPVSTTSGDVDTAEIAYSDLYRNFLATFLADDLGADHQYAGGYRPQTATLQSVPVPGDPTMNEIEFELQFFDGDLDKFVIVLASLQSGSVPLFDERLIDLAFDELFLLTLGNQPFLGNLIGASAGTTSSVTAPSLGNVPVLVAALGFDTGTLTIGSLTDAIPAVIP